MRRSADDLQRLIDDLRFLEDDKIALEDQLRSSQSTSHDLLKSNEDLKSRLETVTLERDKIQAFAINIVTRLQVIGENVANVISEAGRSAVQSASRQQEQRQEAERFGAPQPRPRPVRVAPPVNPHAVPPTISRPVERNPEPDPELEDLVKSFPGTAMPRNAYP